MKSTLQNNERGGDFMSKKQSNQSREQKEKSNHSHQPDQMSDLKSQPDKKMKGPDRPST
jgi:hypothetical protein